MTFYSYKSPIKIQFSSSQTQSTLSPSLLKNQKDTNMEISKTLLLVVSLVAATCFLQARAAGVYCSNPYSKCYRKYIECPEECPSTTAMNSKYKVCYADCDKRPCTSQCRSKFFRLLVIQVSTFSMLSCTLYCIFQVIMNDESYDLLYSAKTELQQTWISLL